MSTTIELRVSGLAELQNYFRAAPERTKSELRTALRTSALLIQRNARIESPVDTGILRSGIQVQLSDTQAIVQTSNKYAVMVHEGTGIYGPNKRPIRPRQGRVLAWKKGGQWHFARSIKGQKPNPFMARAVESSRAGVNAAFDRAVSNIIGG